MDLAAYKTSQCSYPQPPNPSRKQCRYNHRLPRATQAPIHHNLVFDSATKSKGRRRKWHQTLCGWTRVSAHASPLSSRQERFPRHFSCKNDNKPALAPLAYFPHWVSTAATCKCKTTDRSGSLIQERRRGLRIIIPRKWT